MAGESIYVACNRDGTTLGAQYTQNSAGWSIQGVTTKIGPDFYSLGLGQQISEYPNANGDTSYIHTTTSGAYFVLQMMPWPGSWEFAENPITEMTFHMWMKCATSSGDAIVNLYLGREARQQNDNGVITNLGVMDRVLLARHHVTGNLYQDFTVTIQAPPFGAAGFPSTRDGTIKQRLTDVPPDINTTLFWDEVTWVVYIETGNIVNGPLRITQVHANAVYGSYNGPGEILDSFAFTDTYIPAVCPSGLSTGVRTQTTTATDSGTAALCQIVADTATIVDDPDYNILFRGAIRTSGRRPSRYSGDLPQETA